MRRRVLRPAMRSASGPRKERASLRIPHLLIVRSRRFRAPGSTGYGSQYSVVRWLRLIGRLDRGQRVLYLPGIAVNRAAVACQGVPDATQGVY